MNNSKIIVGVDEVGRGPLAGPVVAASVVIGSNFPVVELLKDSKKISDKKRRELSNVIKNYCDYSIESISPEEIDKHNIYQATKMAMVKSVAKLGIKPDEVLIDGNMKFEQDNYSSIIKGDSLVPVISAASIIAKVARDDSMIELSEAYPDYFWDKNKGYGTKDHILAIQKFGLTKHHRKTFCTKFV